MRALTAEGRPFWAATRAPIGRPARAGTRGPGRRPRRERGLVGLLRDAPAFQSRSERIASATWGASRSACMLAIMGAFDRVTIEPGKMGGQPCIRGHRFTVEHLLGLVGAGWTLEQIQEDFPFIEAADIQQAVAYASFSVREFHLPISRSA